MYVVSMYYNFAIFYSFAIYVILNFLRITIYVNEARARPYVLEPAIRQSSP